MFRDTIKYTSKIIVSNVSKAEDAKHIIERHLNV
jgi:hypothetical protein